MRNTIRCRSLLAGILTFAAACDDSSSPLDPATTEQAAPGQEASASLAPRWADAYLRMTSPTAPAPPSSLESYNRGGGKITVRRPAGTTGRYIVTFGGLSGVIGARSTIHVTGYSYDFTFCKPMNGILVADKVEVRCFEAATGAAVNAAFTVSVLGKAAGRAFAYAHQPTTPYYSANAKGSYNPSGNTLIARVGTGFYLVSFDKLGSQLQGRGGHVQVNAVSSGKAHCKANADWATSPSVKVIVQCFTTNGNPVDARFTALFQLPAAHLAYAYADQPLKATYAPNAYYSSNPAGGPITVNRLSPGDYIIEWAGIDQEIIDVGNMQVTAIGENDYAHCKIRDAGPTAVAVRCFAPNGFLVNTPFAVLLGS